MNKNEIISKALATIAKQQIKTDLPEFKAGDTVKVHNRIVEGNKERTQIFEGVVLRRSRNPQHPSAVFTVRKISYNIGVERTFMLHSPRVEKIEVMTLGKVRRAKLYYLRPLRGKATRIKSKFVSAKAAAPAVVEEASA